MNRWCLLLVSCLLTALPVGGGIALAGPPAPPGPSAPPGPATAETAEAEVVEVVREDLATPLPDRPATRALSVLRRWDARRAAAWATGDPAALRGLYAAGARAGERDRRMLARWAARGLRVVDLQVQVLSARLVRSRPGRLVLVVTDRVAGGRAVGRGIEVRLPRGGARTRLVELRRDAGRWRMNRVTAPSAHHQVAARPR